MGFKDLLPKQTDSDESFDKEILPNTLKLEGGYTVDSGGPTNYGITQSTYSAYRKKRVLAEAPVTKITPQETRDIYYNEYYKPHSFGTLPKNIAGLMFDFGVNVGPKQAVKYLQAVVGEKQDGVFGPKTKDSVDKFLKEYDEPSLGHAILQMRTMHNEDLAYRNPTKYGKYKQGWTNRVNTLRNLYIKE